MASKARVYSIRDVIVLVLFLAGGGCLYVGFFFPDPHIYRAVHPVWVVGLLGGARLGIPVLTIVALMVYHKVKTGRLAAVNVALCLAACFLMLLLAYPVANHLYFRSSGISGSTGRLHSFLQLAPPDLTDHADKPKKRLCIMCLGGSTTAFKDSLGRGWPGRVQQRLRDRLERPDIEVHNMGTPWYTSLHTLINYQANLRHHKPDVIIVMHGINDLLHNADFCYFSRGEFRDDYGHFFGPISKLVTRRGIETSLAEKLRMFWYHKPRRVVDQTTFPGLLPFERNLNALVDLAEKDGVRVVLMTQPFLFKETMTAEERDVLIMLNVEAVGPEARWSLHTALSGMQAYNAVTRRIATSRGLPLIDLEKDVPKTLEYFEDDVHYQDVAYDLVAECVTKGLVQAMAADVQQRRGPAGTRG